MTNLSTVLVAAAAILFVLSTISKIQRPWMIGIGLALYACSSLAFFNRRIG